MLIGLLFAFAAALAYGGASVLQAVAVRRSGAEGGSPTDLLALKHQPLYFLGLGLDGAGFVGTVVALQFLPLFLVQSVVAASVGVTAVIAAALGVRLGRSGVLALVAAGVGLVLLSLSADSEAAGSLAAGWRWLLLGATLPIGLLAVIAPRLTGRSAATVLALGAGLGFTVVAIASRSLVVPDPAWRTALDPGFWAILAAGGTAVVLFALALQAGSVTMVSAVTFTTETVIPAGVGLAFLGDGVRPGHWPIAVAGFVLAVCGAIALARFAEHPTDRSSSSTPPSSQREPGRT